MSGFFRALGTDPSSVLGRSEATAGNATAAEEARGASSGAGDDEGRLGREAVALAGLIQLSRMEAGKSICFAR